MKPTLQTWYTNKSILVTGGTGFMGKVMVEKLLRCIPGIKHIYLLVRSKGGMMESKRIEEMSKLPLFEKLVSRNSSSLEKIILVKADMSLEGLGISDDDRAILAENVSIVFHFAAKLSLNAHLKESIIENTLGTMRLLEISREFKKLEVFVHLSTAFCHCDIALLEEKVYPPNRDPYEMIKLVQTQSDREIQQMEKKLMEPHPNAYVFSKRLAEVIATDAGKELPVVIARPSIVVPSLRDPIPGWVDSIESPAGIFIAAGKGILRTMMCDGDAHAEIIPVDTATNSIISIAWNRASERYEETPVYNITTGDIVKITWKEILEKARKVVYDYPFEWTLWYPDGDVLESFSLRTWHFKNDNGLLLEKDFTEDDVATFPIVSTKFDIDEYFTLSQLGLKYYLLHENPKLLPFWRIYIRFLYCLDKMCKFLICYFIVRWILQLIDASSVLNLNLTIDRI